MAATNAKTKSSHVYADERLAGGYGPRAAKQSEEMALRRLVMACLLWEDGAYTDGTSVAEQIKTLVPLVPAAIVADMAIEARVKQKLRHVPLLLVREMARHASHRGLVAKTLAEVIRRPDELSEFVSLYWKGNDGKKTLSAQVKKGLAAAFGKFNEYQLAKWNREGKEVKLRDVLFLCHARPGQERDQLYKRLIAGTLETPDTWEVGLSAAKTADEKRAVWERLLAEQKLGAFAFLKNLRNMRDVGVSRDAIANGLGSLKPDMLLPLDFLKAAKHAPEWTRELEAAMLSCASTFPKLPGWTVLVVDVSGSMCAQLSSKSEFSRMDAAASMAVLAAEMCEHVSVYATAGSDHARQHATEWLKPVRGFAMSEAILHAANRLGGGGIFTRQCIDFIKEREKTTPDRIIVFSDSQDCDFENHKKPSPFGKHNYIVDVSCHKHGINYAGVWTAEVSGWSEHFLRFIAACEGDYWPAVGN